MKWYTEPNGKFVIKIPIDWQYKNLEANIGEKSPFCFEPYENPISSFQISCYSSSELRQNPNVPVQKAGTDKLNFITSNLDNEDFCTKLWFASVDDHTFIAKFVYSAKDEKSEKIKSELKIVENALASLQLLRIDKRPLAIELDKYDKFMAALAASFDIKEKALKNDAVIEFMVIVANQIDAYLRMSLVLRKQLKEKTDKVDTSLLFQGDSDQPVMERSIYKQALAEKIIDQVLFDDLDQLYKERNKVIHQYIITDFKTRTLYKIGIEYEKILERVRKSLKKMENQQATEKIGIYKSGLKSARDISDEDRNFLYSQVNDKHLVKGMKRKIQSANKVE